MAKPSAYLFYGTDSWASSMALRRWRSVFEEKYGLSGSFCVDADELTAARLAEELQASLQGLSLFDDARLVVVRRVTAQEKGKSMPQTQELIRILEAYLANPIAGLTLAVWIEHGLAPTHPLLKAFTGWAATGQAKLQEYQVPSTQSLAKTVRAYLAAYDQDIDPGALLWLSEQYGRLERQARLASRLKPGEPLLEDDRSWWLRQVLEGAALRAGAVLTRSDLEAGHRQVAEPVGTFDLVNAVVTQSWQRARQYAAQIEAQVAGDASLYFGLYAALRWQLKRRNPRFSEGLSQLALRLLGEVELIAKNTTLEAPWLFDVLLMRLEAASTQVSYIVEPRRLWLSQLPRS